MSQKLNSSASESEKIAVPQYLIISALTILGIGPQYFSNLSYILNQGIIQNGLEIGSNHLLIPSTLSNLAFALGVPFGPVLTRKCGLRRNYLLFIFIFLCGSIVSTLSSGLVILTIGRVIQGLSAGMLFLTILPVSLRSFPNAIRNTFLFMVITGLFGASAIGALFGSISLRVDAWRWLFILNVVSSVLCLIIGFLTLPKNVHEHDHSPIDKTGVFLLTLIMAVLAFPLCNLVEKGITSVYVWPFLLVGFMLVILFIYVDLKAKTPIVPFKSLKAAKPISGTIMAVASHASLVVSLAGINGFLRNNMDLPFVYLSHFYLWFFVGIVFTAIFKTIFYDKLGAGILGIIGSLIVLFVSMKWRVIGTETSLTTLYFEVACVGAGISMTLVAGALGTALAGDIHQAAMRSTTLHSIRNFVGAVASPVIGWFLTVQNAANYEDIRGHLDPNSSEFKWEMTKLIHSFMENHMSLTDAKSAAVYQLVANAKKSAVLGAYHHLFTILLVLSIIMLIGSIGKALTGKGRALVQKQTRMLLPSPKEQETPKTSA